MDMARLRFLLAAWLLSAPAFAGDNPVSVPNAGAPAGGPAVQVNPGVQNNVSRPGASYNGIAKDRFNSGFHRKASAVEDAAGSLQNASPDLAKSSGQQIEDALVGSKSNGNGAVHPSPPVINEGRETGAVYAADAETARDALGGEPAAAKVLYTLGGAEGNATLVEIAGVRWVRKWWPQAAGDALARVQNELFFNQFIAAYEPETFAVVEKAVAVPDGKGGYYYFTRYREDAAKDDARYETGLSERQRTKLTALRFVWGLADLHDSNVLFTRDGRPFLLDFEMAGDNGDGLSNKVFDRSALKAPSVAAVQNLVYFKDQPFFQKQTNVQHRIDVYLREVSRWQARLADPGFLARVEGMLRRSQFSEDEIQSYLRNVRANAAHFERNFKPYLDEANEIVKRRRQKYGFLFRLKEALARLWPVRDGNFLAPVYV